MNPCIRPKTFLASLAIALFSATTAFSAWELTASIKLDATVVAITKDPGRNRLYALNRTGNELLFIDLGTGTIQKLYVGKRPTSMAISEDGSKLYVANAGTGTGTSAGYQIAVVNLATRVKTGVILTNHQPVNLARAGGRLYYNDGAWEDGNIHDVPGNTGVIDLATETELGEIAEYRIKSHMVVNSAGTKLFGQYVYTGNLGEMGVFDIDVEEVSGVSLQDSHPYSPYPYGWDYNNYSISADGNRLAYGNVLFNANDLVIQYGMFRELVHALNGDGSLAFGANTIWDTSTFESTGDAKAVIRHGLASNVMCFDSNANCLYAFTPKDYSIKRLELLTEPVSAKPDASVSKNPTSTFSGKGIINSTGVRQMASLKLKKRATKTAYLRVENTSLSSGRVKVKVRGTAGSKRFPVKYLDAKGKDVTKAVVAGSYLTASLAGGEATVLQMMVSAPQNAKKGAAATFKMTFQGANNALAKDVAGASVKVE